MIERVKYMTQILNSVSKRSVPENIRYLNLLTTALFNLVQSLHDKGEDLELHQNDFEGKFLRYGLANHSIIKLTSGNKFKLITKETNMTDIFSINSISRMQIESFVVMYYLYFDNVDKSILKFRYLIYKLHGLQKQSSFKVTGEFSRKKYEEIQLEIRRVIELIEEHPLYLKATEKQQSKYLEPRSAKLLSTYDVLKKTNLTAQRVDTLWNLFSNHIHSEHIGDRQYQSIYINDKSTKASVSTSLTFNSILTAYLCQYLIDNFNSAKQTFNEFDLEIQTVIDTWNKIGKEKVANST